MSLDHIYQLSHLYCTPETVERTPETVERTPETVERTIADIKSKQNSVSLWAEHLNMRAHH